MTELTTICYITRGNDILFIRKSGGLNRDKYLGLGGHMEEHESPRDTILREISEESGIQEKDLKDLTERGFITFINTVYPDEHIHVFTAEFTGDPDSIAADCDEGGLMWIDKEDIYDLPVWEADRKMFDLLFSGNGAYFSMKVTYDKDTLNSLIVY